ncbi:MAG: hypothetical protein ACREE6_18295, partial [Limisphaerales bacterium]
MDTSTTSLATPDASTRNHSAAARARVNRELILTMASIAFKTFAQKISSLPPQAILGALDRECDGVRRSLAKSQNGLSDHDYSIFYFKIFTRAAKLGDEVDLMIRLPANEVEFFRRTTIRLVQARLLPVTALDHFARTFRVTDKAEKLQMRREHLKRQKAARLCAKS